MIQLVTFDAAGTLLRSSWEPELLVIDSALQTGLEINMEKAKEVFLDILKKNRARHEEIELRSDPAEIKAFWVGLIAQWLEEIQQDPIHSREIYELTSQKIFSGKGEVFSVYDDVLHTLDELKNKNMKLGVISNWDSSLHKILQSLKLDSYFDFVIASLEFGVEKPDPKIFHFALEKANVNTRHALHIGDSFEDDYLGAKNAGWHAILLDRGGLYQDVPEVISDLRNIEKGMELCA